MYKYAIRLLFEKVKKQKKKNRSKISKAFPLLNKKQKKKQIMKTWF